MSEQKQEMWYISTARDFKGGTEPHRVYYGLTFRTKAEDLTTPAQLEQEQKVMDTIQAWMKESPLEEARFPKSAAIERYEVYEVETGDLLVMYRVPFEPIGSPVSRSSYVN
jgi:hypothetical protein